MCRHVCEGEAACTRYPPGQVAHTHTFMQERCSCTDTHTHTQLERRGSGVRFMFEPSAAVYILVLQSLPALEDRPSSSEQPGIVKLLGHFANGRVPPTRPNPFDIRSSRRTLFCIQSTSNTVSHSSFHLFSRRSTPLQSSRSRILHSPSLYSSLSSLGGCVYMLDVAIARNGSLDLGWGIRDRLTTRDPTLLVGVITGKCDS